MKSSINNLLTRSVLQRFRQDQGKQFLQVTGKAGEVRSDVEQICQYGFRSRPLDKARGIMFAYMGDKDNASVALVDDQRHGQDTLGEGEVMVFNDGSCRIKLLDDTITAEADTRIKATVGTTSVDITDGTIEATADTEVKMQVASTWVSVVSGSITFSIDGVTWVFDSTKMNGTANIITTGTIDSNGVELDNHVHSGVTSGGSNTGGPI